MNYKTRAFPEFSDCGLNCGLCSQNYRHTNGAFRCPGCAGEGFSDAHPAVYLLTVNLLELEDVKEIMQRIESEMNPADPIKEKAKATARLFQTVADEQNIAINLRGCNHKENML